MAFVRIDLTGTKESEVVPEGEYELRVVKVDDTESKKGNPMTVVTLRIEDSDCRNPSLVTHYITYPSEDLPDNLQYLRSLEIKRLLTLFGVEYSSEGFDSEDLLGQTARGMLIQEEGDDGVVRNKLRLPRLRDR
jgi:Protein of unknown function (DUF669)